MLALMKLEPPNLSGIPIFVEFHQCGLCAVVCPLPTLSISVVFFVFFVIISAAVAAAAAAAAVGVDIGIGGGLVGELRYSFRQEVERGLGSL